MSSVSPTELRKKKLIDMIYKEVGPCYNVKCLPTKAKAKATRQDSELKSENQALKK